MKLEHVEEFLELNHYIPENQADWIIGRVKMLEEIITEAMNALMETSKAELAIRIDKILKEEDESKV